MLEHFTCNELFSKRLAEISKKPKVKISLLKLLNSHIISALIGILPTPQTSGVEEKKSAEQELRMFVADFG